MIPFAFFPRTAAQALLSNMIVFAPASGCARWRHNIFDRSFHDKVYNVKGDALPPWQVRSMLIRSQ
jgi:hypothetical protein